MKIYTHILGDSTIAEVMAEGIFLHQAEDGVDLLGNLYYQGFEAVILHEKNLAPAFFDLSTGLAGEVLQKFATYRMRLALVGDFSVYASQSLQDFIFESNQSRHINFVSSLEEALKVLSV